MLLLLYGEESFLRARKLQEIKERYLGLHKGASYLRSFDCSEPRHANDIVQEIRGASLFSEKKLIVLENPFSSKDVAEDLLEYTDELLRTPHTLVFCQEGEVGTNDPLFLFLKTHGKTQEFSALAGRRLEAWVQQEFLRYGEESSLEVQDALIRAVGNDLWRLSNEIQKLATFKTAPALSRHDVEALVEPMVSSDIFATIDAISSGNKKEALAMLQGHEKRGDSPFYILSMMGFQFRTLLAVQEMAQKNLSYHSIVQKVKLHPYVVKKASEAAQRLTFQELKDAFGRIFTIELGLKTGALAPSGALSWFVLGK